MLQALCKRKKAQHKSKQCTVTGIPNRCSEISSTASGSEVELENLRDINK